MAFAVKLLTVLLGGLIWLGIVAFLRLKKKKSAPYLIFFTIFYIYIFEVLDYTLLQFQSLLLLKYFMPNLMLRQTAGKEMNLIPLIALTSSDVRTSLLNILMMIPFGFGLPFITSLRLKGIILTGALVSISIELLQLVTGLLAQTTFRIADINDVIFNTLGAVIGYALFIGFLRIYRRMSEKMPANAILTYISELRETDT